MSNLKIDVALKKYKHKVICNACNSRSYQMYYMIIETDSGTEIDKYYCEDCKEILLSDLVKLHNRTKTIIDKFINDSDLTKKIGKYEFVNRE